MKSLLIITGILIFPYTTYASSSDDERESIKKLDDICLEVRTEKLKVVQQKKIEACVNVDKQDRSYCERFFKVMGGEVQQQLVIDPAVFLIKFQNAWKHLMQEKTVNVRFLSINQVIRSRSLLESKSRTPYVIGLRLLKTLDI